MLDMSGNPTVEVCRDFQDKRCSRDERFCKYAHPHERLDITNGRVVCCVDFLKNRCSRENPPCKFYHPPSRIRDKVVNELRSSRHGRSSSEGDSAHGKSLAAGLQSALVNTLLPQLNTLTDKIKQCGNSDLDPSVAETLKSCQAMLDTVAQSSYGGMHQRNDAIEVCREFLRGVCNRGDSRCKFAHPDPRIHVNSDQTVTICLRFLRGTCKVKNCKYFHVPRHLKKYVPGDLLHKRRKRKLSTDRDEEEPHSKRQVSDDNDSSHETSYEQYAACSTDIPTQEFYSYE